MTAAVTRWLAERAAAEADSRAGRYPALVEAGKVERFDADADLAAWRAIAALFADGSAGEAEPYWAPAKVPLSWEVLELAASRALIRAEAVVKEKGERPHLVERRDAIQAIHARLAIQRELHSSPLAGAQAA